MEITVGDRIQSAIDHMEKSEIDLALSDVCIAVDITAQKYYQDASSSSCYKAFLKENMWMIIVTGMGSLISSSIKIPFQHKDIKSDAQGFCTLEQVVYHIMRCGLIHGTGKDSKIIWNARIPLALDQDGNLNLSPSFIWGLALSVIACDTNRDEKADEMCWISTASFKYLINDLWGKKDSVKKMVKSQYNVII